jgi:hypothetical protein
MNRVIRLTESELVNLVKRVIIEQASTSSVTAPPQTKMSPLSVPRLILADNTTLSIYPDRTKIGQTTPFIFTGSPNGIDPDTGKPSPNIVTIQIKNGEIPNIEAILTYDCTKKTIVSQNLNNIKIPENGGAIPRVLKNNTGRAITVDKQRHVQTKFVDPGISLTTGPAPQIIGQFCKTTS